MKMRDYYPMAISIAKGHAFLYGKIVKDSGAESLNDKEEKTKRFDSIKGSGKLDECIAILGEEEARRYFMGGIVNTRPRDKK